MPTRKKKTLKDAIHALNKLSIKIWNSPRYQILIFVLTTVFILLSVGYYFGTFDQASHIPFLKKLVNPTLYDHDKFFDLQKLHYSYFWFLFIPFYKMGLLEPSMFICYLLSVFLTSWSIWRLSRTLFNDPLTSFLSVIILCITHVSFGGFTITEFSLVNRVFVLPFLLLAIDFYLRKRYITAYLLLGLMYNIHIISVNFVLAMFILDGVVRMKEIKLKNFICYLIIFIASALPVLIWKFSSSGIGIGPDYEWYHIISKGFLSNVFYFFINPPFFFTTLGGISTLYLFFVARKHVKTGFNNIISNFIYSSIIILIVEYITAEFFPSVLIIQSQIIRVGIFILIFSYLYLIRYITQEYQKGNMKDSKFLAMIFSTFLSLLPITLFLTVAFQKKLTTNIRLLLMCVMISVLSAISLFIAYKYEVWRPGVHIYAEDSAYYRTQIWAKNNTKKNSVFITPPSYWWWYNVEWRVGSERATVVVLSDLLEAAFSPRYISYWKPRFEDLAPHILNQFDGNIVKNRVVALNAYNALSKPDILRIGKKYGANYFVSVNPHIYQLPIVFSNEEYTVYKIKN